MKDQIKKLNRISKIVDLSVFYVITIYQNGIYLQGNLTSETKSIISYCDLKFDKENNWFEGNYKGFKITLTIK